MKLVFFLFLSISCFDKEDKNTTNQKKYLLNDLHVFSFKYLNDTIKKMEGDFCFRSKKYLWINSINDREIIIPFGIYNERCKNIVGRMPTGDRIILMLKEKSFLYNGNTEYSFDSIYKVFEKLNLFFQRNESQKEIFLGYPDINKELNFSPLLKGIEKYISIKEKTIDSLPVFYFIIPK